MIMLETFAWESYKQDRYGLTKWRNLQEQVGEISKYFDSVWLPPSAYSGDGMGYWPFQLSNQNGEWGSEDELRKLIDSFHDNLVTVYADVVVTHRKDKGDGTFFNDKFVNEYHLSKQTDSKGEITHPGGGSCPMYDLNPKVISMLREYLDYIKYGMGYNGYRVDLAKALPADVSKELFCDKDLVIHEYYDTNYDLLKNYISMFDKRHKMFNFNQKYVVINEGLAKSDLTKLSFNGKPGGMMDSPLRPQLVNFVENHDTYDCFAAYVESTDKDKILLANAYMLMMNADCCVFWGHWYDYKDELKKLINIRKHFGIGTDSKVDILHCSKDLYLQNISCGDKDVQLLIHTDENYKLKLKGDACLLYRGKYFAIISQSKEDLPDVDDTPKKVIPTVTRDKIVLTVKKKWKNTYLWTQNDTWPGKKLRFKNGESIVVVRKVPFYEFTLNNGDPNDPKQLPNMRIYESTTI